ncbi:diketogulonate reductase-like aldo/keto reductase [Paenibacillus endophyticus]|uniref:Diketogulonate reductase-like aldo/keto reductase n=1 Tax=Paenibacillus endophyticus TaxID=1294268 RepID=A0A7W5C709_9BACL|nr:aldo/keto reductase [Paenibacillus endophyticus]MBB3151294.1 diketogulonate reductase-like aldo/keto reductase [Paenibacillus endophyticus]
MSQARTESTILSNGVKMPWLGLGVWKVKDDGEAERSVASAIEAGYRSIDTAAAYNNETGVGAGIRNSGIARDDIFVTTKIWNAHQGYESTLTAFEDSRRKLGLDVVDLLLIHWPVKDKYTETWRALEKLYRDGFVRAIGVSNFQIHHLRDVISTSEFVPMVNQVEYHPLLTQTELHTFAKSSNIQLMAWSPLMQGNLDQSVFAEIGAKYGKSPAQVVLRWDLQNEVVTIPKSVNPVRQQENADIFDFTLTDEEVALISGLNRNQRFGPDPDNFNF